MYRLDFMTDDGPGIESSREYRKVDSIQNRCLKMQSLNVLSIFLATDACSQT